VNVVLNELSRLTSETHATSDVLTVFWLWAIHYCTRHMLLGSVSNGSTSPASRPGLNRKNGSVQFQTGPTSRPAPSWLDKPVPLPVKLRVLPGLAGPVGFGLRFSFSGVSIYGHCQICYCYVQNINFGTLFSLFVSMVAFILKTRRDMLPATS
jgi:hypothetical protein